MKRVFGILLIVAAVFVLGFALAHFLRENAQNVRLYFLAWRTYESSLGVLVSLSFIVGLLVSAVIFSGILISRSLELRRLKRELTALERLMEIKEQKEADKA
ncbi:MAG: LapA family protein [Bradymonadales bacterium]|nr:MAG: LapA family protein [Bradymonadales bacterium]